MALTVYRYGHKKWLRDEVNDGLNAVRARWLNVYTDDYATLRHRVSLVALTHSPIDTIEGENIDDDVWVSPIDDDDWHCPEIVQMVSDHAEGYDVLWFYTSGLRMVEPAHYSPIWSHYGRIVPHCSGLFIRWGAIKDFTEMQRRMLFEDHTFAVNHAVRFGLRCKHVPEIAAVWCVTPLSVTVAHEFKGVPQKPAVLIDERLRVFGLPKWIEVPALEIATILMDHTKH